MYMVLDVPSYTLDIVYEFYVNLANMIKRDGTPWVFVRKHMYEFSPGIINSIFKTPCQEADFPCMPWTTKNLDDAVSTITGGKKNGWGNLSMLDVTPSMNIMFKFCVFHWMPTVNRSTLTIDRLKFIHKLTEGRPFEFGVMVFGQIYELEQQAISGKANKLFFPNLIQHVLEMQHPIPVRGVDANPVALVKMVLDLKQGLPNKPAGTGSAKYSLNKDMGRYHRLLDTIVGRAARGVYGDLSTLGDSSSNDEAGEAGAEDHNSLSDECLMMIDIQKGGDCRGVKITKVFNQNNAEQVGVFGGSHSKKENDVANEDLSIVRIYIKSRDSRSRVEDLRLFQEDQIIY
ncbi:hypothetical protein DY000_02053055 [Brassica cretica]|uniref:Putative plant transposon protein domain-containing protein n=1 Tax=Brassica cretica TaxID=69181 RepID=A0ABQ7AH09_BRACR|nr:hypothetical protein DY000_02053055 [Brassica cretica]